MKTQPRRLLNVVHDVKSGKIKLADVRPGIQKKVARMVNEFTLSQLDDYVARPAPAQSHFQGIREPVRVTRAT